MIDLTRSILEYFIEALGPQRHGLNPAKQRCVALAITKIEEAVSWLEKANVAEAMQKYANGENAKSDSPGASESPDIGPRCPTCLR